MVSGYKNKKVLVVGLGFSGGGVGVAKFLLRKGAHVTVTDIKTKKELAPSLRALGKRKNLSFVLGRYPKNLTVFDAIVLNPAIDLHSEIVKKIRKEKVPVESEVGLFLKNCRGKVIAITGTKGKGTTVSLIYEMLKRGGKKVLLGGNIGGSLLDGVEKITENTFVVLEISSFQLDLLAVSKQKANFYISALTNIYPDHLDRYNSFGGYKKSKLSIFKYPSQYKINKGLTSARLPQWIDVNKIALIGGHNRKNIALAVKIAKKLRIKNSAIQKAVHSFRGLPYRLEYAGEKSGVRFYNDSYSTTPDSTIAALRSFDKKMILILGGASKGASFKNLAREAKKRAKVIILFGKSASEINRTLLNVQGRTLHIVSTEIVKTLREAVHYAEKVAAKGDVILFSPACASFDQFRNAKERGEAFRKLAHSL